MKQKGTEQLVKDSADGRAVPLNKMIGNLITEERKRQNMSQAVLAELIGAAGHSYISNVEKGRAGISIERLFDIALAFGVNVYTILPDGLMSDHCDKPSGKQECSRCAGKDTPFHPLGWICQECHGKDRTELADMRAKLATMFETVDGLTMRNAELLNENRDAEHAKGSDFESPKSERRYDFPCVESGVKCAGGGVDESVWGDHFIQWLNLVHPTVRLDAVPESVAKEYIDKNETGLKVIEPGPDKPAGVKCKGGCGATIYANPPVEKCEDCLLCDAIDARTEGAE